MMKKIFTKIIIGILIIAVIFAFGKNIIVKTAVTAGVRAITGLKLSIKKMNIGLLNTLIGINELKLYNPPGFEDPIMVDLPEIYVDYDLWAFFKKEIHLTEVRLTLKELVVVKNKDGKINIDSLKTLPAEKTEEPEEKKPSRKKKGKPEMPKIQIDVLKLKIGKVIYKDYSGKGDVSVKEFNVNIDAQYENITDPHKIVNIIVARALMNTTISGLTNITGGIFRAGKNVGDTAVDTAKGAVKKTTDVIKNILPFGGKGRND